MDVGLEVQEGQTGYGKHQAKLFGYECLALKSFHTEDFKAKYYIGQ